ncbi:activator-dependent family glycosyltransferase [Micromonospora sp. NPDC049559]|uniref:activator-dependent family glycosyltransferase n=1 Tax=Micromonospora sp. NPDC049559 TaxID=3155923 RepID=UPI00341C50F5
MRILMTSFAMDAHFNGSVPLAWALRTAGHEVRVASQPALTESITRAGLTAVPVGTDHDLDHVVRQAGPAMYAQHADPDFLEHRPHLLDLRFLRSSNTLLTATFYAQLNNDTMVDELVDFARYWRPDLVIWEPFTFAGAIAARASGAAHARLLSFPDTFLGVRQVFRKRLAQAPAEQYEDTLEEWLTWTLDRFDLKFDEEIVTGQWTVDQMPASVALPLGQPTIAMRYVPYNGPGAAVVPDWLRAEPTRPRVCLTLGETVRKTEFPNAVAIDEVFAAVGDLDVELVAMLSAAERAQAGHVPENIRIVDHVTLHALLPTCSAIVNHGGAGTWATAAVYGVPQVALGWMWDAIYRARRLEALGAGVHIPSFQLTAAGLREKLVTVLEDPSYRAGAQRLRQEMLASPSPNDVVPVLERLAAGHRTPPR